jgi:histidinol phosphatase-like PHP family hydrolase
MGSQWCELQLHQIDLHYHSGTERNSQHSVDDYLGFAVASGRKVIGVTDHWGRYFQRSHKTHNHYEPTEEGFRQFASEVRGAAEGYPDVRILFGPELGVGAAFSDVGERMFTLPEVEFFIGESGASSEGEHHGDYLLRVVKWIAETREMYGKPGFLAHPLRNRINLILGKTGVDDDYRPKLPLSTVLPPLASYDDPQSHVEDLLDVRIDELASAMIENDVSIELNQSSWGRILGMNAEWFAERYLYFMRRLIELGVSVVLGSDQHGVESPAPAPFQIAWLLGVKATDVTFLRHWLGSPEC